MSDEQRPAEDVAGLVERLRMRVGQSSEDGYLEHMLLEAATTITALAQDRSAYLEAYNKADKLMGQRNRELDALRAERNALAARVAYLQGEDPVQRHLPEARS